MRKRLFSTRLPHRWRTTAARTRAEWKELSRADELWLLAAAQTLRVRPGRGTKQALGDHAAIAVLLGSGLRVSELLNLNSNQYDGRGFRKVLARGGRIRDFVLVKADARQVLEEWPAERGDTSDPMFPTRTGKPLCRMQFFKALQRVAESKGVEYAKEASGHRSDLYIWRYVKPNRESLADAIDSLD